LDYVGIYVGINGYLLDIMIDMFLYVFGLCWDDFTSKGVQTPLNWAIPNRFLGGWHIDVFKFGF